MNRNQLLQVCKERLAAKRAMAQNEAYQNLIKARENLDFSAIEKEERAAVFEIGKLKGFGKPHKKESEHLEQIRKRKAEILNNIGFSTADLQPKYSCTKCNDLGYQETKMCSCLKTLLNQILIQESGAGKEHLADFKDFNADITTTPEHKDMLIKIKKKFENIVSSYPLSFPKFILLSGKTGVGKTFITECLANALIEKGYLASFITAFGMNNMFLSYHTCFDSQKQTYMNALIDPDVLVIDDLGTEPNLKNVTIPYLYILLSERSRLNKLTVVTTNLEPLDIITKYNERIFSRLCHKKECFMTRIVGTDLRLNKN